MVLWLCSSPTSPPLWICADCCSPWLRAVAWRASPHCRMPTTFFCADNFASAPPSLPGGAHHPPAVQLMGDAAASDGGQVLNVSPPRAAGAPLPDGTAMPPSAEGAQGWASAGYAPGLAAGEDDSSHSRRSSVPDLAGSRHGYSR